MSIFGKGEREAFKVGSTLGDLNALASGNPEKIEQHWIRKFLYRIFGSFISRLF